MILFLLDSIGKIQVKYTFNDFFLSGKTLRYFRIADHIKSFKT